MGKDMVRNDVFCFIEPKKGKFRQNPPFFENRLAQNPVENRNPVAGD